MQSGPQIESNIESSKLDELSRYWRDLLRPCPEDHTRRTLQDAFSELLKGLSQNLAFDHLGLGLFNPAAKTIDVLLQAGEKVPLPPIPVCEGSLGLVIDHGQALEISDTEAEQNFPDLVALTRSRGFRCIRIVPLRTQRRTLGGLAVVRKQPGRFSQEDIQHLQHAAQLVALVLENVMMADVLGWEKARLQTLLDVNSRLISSLDMQQIFQAVSGLLRRVVNQDYTYLAIHEQDCDAMKFCVLDWAQDTAIVGREILVPVFECPAGISYKRGENMQFSQSDLALIGSPHTNELLAAGIRTVSCFPLVSHGRRFGALGFASTGNVNPSADDIALLTQIAAQVAMAIASACAYEEVARLKDRLAKEKLYLEDEIRSHHNFGEVVGNSPALRQVLSRVEIAAPSDATVLVVGETGTGKELIARALHRLSARRDGNFIKLSCAAIPTWLLESELFGHEKGAFTGAISQKVGRLELADQGTLFLDEIGEIPLELQPKLVRVLQDQEFERLGGVRTVKVNVRVIAATNRDLEKAVGEHQFHQDLYDRLNVFPIRLPALRDRPGDIPLLVRYFVQKFGRRMGKVIESIPVELMRELERCDWPGNIRDLENFLERSVILTQGPVLCAPIAELRAASPDRNKNAGTLEDVEREYIVRTLRESRGVIAGVNGAAARLGMKRTTLQSRMQKLGITREHYVQ